MYLLILNCRVGVGEGRGEVVGIGGVFDVRSLFVVRVFDYWVLWVGIKKGKNFKLIWDKNLKSFLYF